MVNMAPFVLRYDFDIFSVDNPRIAAGLTLANGQGSHGAARDHKVVARFRHKRTSDAVTQAPPIVRLFLEEAGFAPKIADIDDLSVDDASSCDELKRALVEQLTHALSNRALKKGLGRVAKESNFDVRAFIGAGVSNGTKDEQFVHEHDVPDYSANEKVMPRRPSQLKGHGIKRRGRPI